MLNRNCAWRLQRRRDPVRGVETAVFTRLCPDRPVDYVGPRALHEWLARSAVRDRPARPWIERGLRPVALRKTTR